MTNKLKLAVLAVTLCAAFSVQASPYSYTTAGTVNVVDAPLVKTPLLSMTSIFSGDGFSGELRSGYGGKGSVFYQIVNYASSIVAIGELSYTGISDRSWRTNNSTVPFVDQTNQAFDIFSTGEAKVSLVQNDIWTCGGCVPDSYVQTLNFLGGPVWTGGMSLEETVYGEVLPGITPGTTSYTGIVYGNFTRGKVNVNGLSVDAFVAVVPEPETYAMLLAGLSLIGAAVKRRKAKQG